MIESEYNQICKFDNNIYNLTIAVLLSYYLYHYLFYCQNLPKT